MPGEAKREVQIASSQWWGNAGLGLLAMTFAIYAIGVAVATISKTSISGFVYIGYVAGIAGIIALAYSKAILHRINTS